MAEKEPKRWVTVQGKHFPIYEDENGNEVFGVGQEADNWTGGNPWDKDLFKKNAEEHGLKIHRDTKLNRDYVVLKNSTKFYHATHKFTSAKLQNEGIKAQDVEGQTKGIYLSGGTHLKDWFGEDDTQLFEVTVRKGTRLYKDVQPNAVFITVDIPKKDIKKL